MDKPYRVVLNSSLRFLADPGRFRKRETEETKAFLNRSIFAFEVCSATLSDWKASR
jgi:hypothetical protein